MIANVKFIFHQIYQTLIEIANWHLQRQSWVENWEYLAAGWNPEVQF